MKNQGKRIAIVGAGLSGLAAAKLLLQSDYEVQIFDKGKGVGGRMSVRRTDGGLAFDHGAQYFTARSEVFQNQVANWVEAGVVAPWEARFNLLSVDLNGKIVSSIEATPAERFVGSPGMNEPLKHLAKEMPNIACSVQVTSIKQQTGLWKLTDQDGKTLGEFDRVIVTAPAPQTAELLSVSPALSNAAKSIKVAPSWACMLAIHNDVAANIPWDAAWIRGLEEPSQLAWAARNDSKPGRQEPDKGLSTWVLHASADWSHKHLEQSPEIVAEKMLSAFERLVDQPLGKPQHLVAHRWKYALPDAMEDHFLQDADRGLYACGDWCGGPRVEGAYLSGVACAQQILDE